MTLGLGIVQTSTFPDGRRPVRVQAQHQPVEVQAQEVTGLAGCPVAATVSGALAAKSTSRATSEHWGGRRDPHLADEAPCVLCSFDVCAQTKLNKTA